MGKLLDEMSSYKTVRKNRNPLVLAVQSMSRQDALDLIDAINNDSISNVAISRVLKNHGIHVQHQMISKYRAGLNNFDLGDYVPKK